MMRDALQITAIVGYRHRMVGAGPFAGLCLLDGLLDEGTHLLAIIRWMLPIGSERAEGADATIDLTAGTQFRSRQGQPSEERRPQFVIQDHFQAADAMPMGAGDRHGIRVTLSQKKANKQHIAGGTAGDCRVHLLMAFTYHTPQAVAAIEVVVSVIGDLPAAWSRLCSERGLRLQHRPVLGDALLEQAHAVLLVRPAASLVSQCRAHTQAPILVISDAMDVDWAVAGSDWTCPIDDPQFPHGFDRWARQRAHLLIDRNERDRARLRAEQQILQQERLATVGQLAASIAHEFNNINAAALGHLEMALRRDVLSDSTVDRLRTVIDALGRSSDISSVMRDLVRGQDAENGPVNLCRLVRDVISLHTADLRKRRITCVPHLPVESWAWGNRAALRHALTNLLLNASQALEGVPDPRIVVSIASDERDCCLAIADNGPGIPEELRERVFEPFFSTKSGNGNSGGSGLGLALCRHLVESCNGTIQMERDPQMGGACFIITLDTSKETGSSSGNHVSQESAVFHTLGSERIVLAEDDDYMRRLMRDTLRRNGHTVITCRNGAEALEILANTSAALFICDWQMPKLEGRQLLKKVHKLPRSHRPGRILVVSSSSSADPKLCDLLMMKPFSTDLLVYNVEQLLSQKEVR